MTNTPEPDLSQIAKLQHQIIADLASISDDIAALRAIALRQDATLEVLLMEVRAMANRVRDLEAKDATRE